jgi:sporulation protein YlmC with PRC-barrel domain
MRPEVAMSQTQLFRLGTDVGCTDGECGTLKSVVVNPGDDVVTHLVVEPKHEQEYGRLVPLRLIHRVLSSAGGNEVRLDCTMEAFGELDAAETTYLSPAEEDPGIRPGGSASWPYYAPPGVMGGPGLPADPTEGAQAVTVDTVPDQLPGEEETTRGQHVHTTDGHVGHVQGIAVDPGTGRVTYVLVRMGHLWRHKVVLVPRSAIADVGIDGFHLNVTTQQCKDFPPADSNAPAHG